MLQKNMMVQLGQQVVIWDTARYGLAGAGTQTAALGFGGSTVEHQQQQKNIMELLGQLLQV
jgi:hypothetical protein